MGLSGECLEGVWGKLSGIHGNRRPTNVFGGYMGSQALQYGTVQKGTVFCRLTILRPQITKMAAYKLSKNDWFMPFVAIFRFTREKLLVTVSFDHPV